MHIAMVGTRGIPAAYGGFETAVEEISRRLVTRGHRVTVFCRGRGRSSRSTRPNFAGVDTIDVPAWHDRRFETLSSSFASLPHLTRLRPDAAVLFNLANSPLLPFLKILDIPTALHVDGLEWLRSKWGRMGRSYYKLSERLVARTSTPLIADSVGIAEHYRINYGRETVLLTYGAPIRGVLPGDQSLLANHGLEPGGYHLVVARLEPENHVREIVTGYAAARCRKPLVIVGDNPYETEYTRAVRVLIGNTDRVHALGSVWDQNLLDALYANAFSYIHGHSVGGTNPSLLRAMGAACYPIAWDVNFNREVAGESASYFDHSEALSKILEEAEHAEADGSIRLRGSAALARAKKIYDWDLVTDGYERLLIGIGHPFEGGGATE